jgi:regulatory protein
MHMTDPNYRKIFDRAAKLLGIRPRSVGQLRERLLEKTDSIETVERVINRLLELGYLNDEEFAYNYALSKLNNRAVGKSRLKHALREKKVPPETIDSALSRIFEEQNEDELCDRAIAKHLRTHGRPADARQSKKLLTYLIRRGFSYDLAIKKLRAISSLDDIDSSDGQ